MNNFGQRVKDFCWTPVVFAADSVVSSRVKEKFLIRASDLYSYNQGGSDGKASVYSEGDLGLIPGSGRSPGETNGNPLQYYCLENPMVGGAW